PRVPGPGEIDLRFVPIAGTAGSHASPLLRVEVANGLSEKAALSQLLCRMGVPAANHLRGAVLAAELVDSSNAVGPCNLADVVIRSKDFPEELNIDGSNFVRVDHLQLVNDESEKAHKFRIEGQKDMWKSRQTFTYPDKESVSDSGIAYIGGEAKWLVQNLKP